MARCTGAGRPGAKHLRLLPVVEPCRHRGSEADFQYRRSCPGEHVQRCSLKEADAIQYEEDDDHRHEGDRGVPQMSYTRATFVGSTTPRNRATTAHPAVGQPIARPLVWAITKVKVTAKMATVTVIRLVPLLPTSANLGHFWPILDTAGDRSY